MKTAAEVLREKVARTQLGDFNPDDYVDVAGYAGCTAEIALEIAEDEERLNRGG